MLGKLNIKKEQLLSAVGLAVIVLVLVCLFKSRQTTEGYQGNNAQGTSADFVLGDKNYSLSDLATSQIVKGTIVVWYGKQGDIPVAAGWALCDGKTHNGVVTPDLTKKFILGAVGDGILFDANQHISPGETMEQAKKRHNEENKYNSSGTGGEEKVALTVDEMPKHSHIFPGDDMLSRGTKYGGSVKSSDFTYDAGSTKDSGNGRYYNTSPTGNSQSHNNMPPYMALYYIMYTG